MRSFTSFAALLLCSLCAAAPRAAPQSLDLSPSSLNLPDSLNSTTSSLATKFSGPSDPARFTFYNTLSPLGVICDADTGPDGITFWYQDLAASKMGQFNYKTGFIQEYEIPYSSGPETTPPFIGNLTALQCVVRTGKDGNIYGGAGIRNEIVQVNPRTDPPTLKIFAPKNQSPTGNLINFNDAWAADEGLYFSQLTANKVTLFNYKTEEFTDFPALTPAVAPLGMRTDKHDNLWYTDFLGQFISKIDALTGQVTEYKDCCPLPEGAFPEVLRSSTENQKYLWANAFGFQGFIRIEPDEPDDSKKFKIFTNPTLTDIGSAPFENDNDFCGRIWYTSPDQNILVYYDPASDEWTTVTVPGIPVTGNFEVTMHRGPGHYMWFSIGTLGKIGRYELDWDCVGQPQ